jgi:hypothetical protein
MAFAFVPDDGPPRLMRYVEHGTLPHADLLSIFIHEQNLLIIDKLHFSSLHDNDKRALLRTHSSYHEITEFTLPRAAA